MCGAAMWLEDKWALSSFLPSMAALSAEYGGKGITLAALLVA